MSKLPPEIELLLVKALDLRHADCVSSIDELLARLLGRRKEVGGSVAIPQAIIDRIKELPRPRKRTGGRKHPTIKTRR